MLLIVVAVFVTVGFSNGQSVINVCTGYDSWAYIPDVTDCAQYFICMPYGPGVNLPERHHCGNQAFNPITLTCDDPENVKCFSCPSNQNNINLAVDNNCFQFVRCVAGVPEQITCEDNLVFDPVHETCNFEDEVGCVCATPSQPHFIRNRFDCSA